MEWIKMGWGKDFSQEFDPKKPFRFDCSNAIISNRPVLDIATDAIKRITEKYPPPYTLLCTGGIDSQAMAYCWMNSGVPFDIVSITYNRDLNDYDLGELYRFSEKFNLTVKSIDFDMIDFLENRLSDYQHKYQCISPQITAYMAMSELVVDGTVLFSGNYITPYNCFLDYTVLGLYRYAMATKRNLIPFFFQHDAELAPAFIPIMQQPGVINKRKSDPSLYKTYEDKIKIYHAAGIPVIYQLNKFSGFEKLKEIYDHKQHLISNDDKVEFASVGSFSKRVFDIEFRYKAMRRIKYIEPLEYIFGVNA
jgi:hypothetical protein